MSNYRFLQSSKRANNKAIKVTSPEEAKMILQSHVLTTAKYDFSVYEKRILYYCVLEAQKCLYGEKLGPWTNVETLARQPAKEITLPIRSVLQGEDDKNHEQIKKAAYSLLDKKIVYEDNKVWTAFTMIQGPQISKTGETITFTVNPILWKCMLDFSKGFHPYELQAAMQLRSVYSMRFYELMTEPQKGWQPVYDIDTIKGWFGLEDKYPLTKDFIKRVILMAQKDLDKHAPWSFDFETIKEGRKIVSIRFTPRQCPQNTNAVMAKSVELRRTDLSWDIPDRAVRDYLRNTIGFTTPELKAKKNREMWKNASAIFRPENREEYLLDILRKKYAAARKKQLDEADTKKYIIGSIQGAIGDFKKKYADQQGVGGIASDIADNLSCE